MTVQAAQPAQQQQKVTYAATTQLQPGIKTQFFTTASITQSQKPTGAQQIQVCAQRWPLQHLIFVHKSMVSGEIFMFFLHYQVAKIPQIVQQQPTVANIQQIVSSPQQVGPHVWTGRSASLCCRGE